MLLPLSSRARPDRLGISPQERRGHPAWTSGACFVAHCGQVWVATRAALLSVTQGDLSLRSPQSFARDVNCITRGAFTRIHAAVTEELRRGGQRRLLEWIQ
jgi:hypothetical protein